MQAGLLRDRITITQETVTGQNSYGEDAVTTATVGQFWANVISLTGRELEVAQQRWAEARYKVIMRHQPGVSITRKMTVVNGGRSMDILDVQDIDSSIRPKALLICKDYDG